MPIKRPHITDVEVGIDRVYDAINTGGLTIFDDCAGILGEVATYRRKVDAEGKPTRDIEEKNRYHRLDALRYIVSRIRR
jgi:hypothetical protein